VCDLADPVPGRIQGGIPVGDRERYVSDHGFGQHHQPQDLREISVLLPAKEGQASDPDGEVVDVEVDGGGALDHLPPGNSRPYIVTGNAFAGHRAPFSACPLVSISACSLPPLT
jgi:hypothetical protein